MKIAVVGSRRYPNRAAVVQLVISLPEEVEILTGACRGVCSWVLEAGRRRGMLVTVLYPDLSKCKGRWEIVGAYYKRDELIAELCDKMFAFPAVDRKGGTEKEIQFAKKHRKEVVVCLAK